MGSNTFYNVHHVGKPMQLQKLVLSIRVLKDISKMYKNTSNNDLVEVILAPERLKIVPDCQHPPSHVTLATQSLVEPRCFSLPV